MISYSLRGSFVPPERDTPRHGVLARVTARRTAVSGSASSPKTGSDVQGRHLLLDGDDV